MTSSTVTLKTNAGETFGAYLALPSHPNGGSVVVLQEIFGINANIRSVADSFAQAGYAAIAPDLFWRQAAGVELDPSDEASRERATGLMKGLDQKLAVQDALIAADHVRFLPGANGKVGAVGYCLGGKLAYLLAATSGIDAAVSYYGVAIQGALDKMGEVQCPLLLHIAQDDHLCPPDAQAAIASAAEQYPLLVSVKVYAGVGHAFARHGSPAFVAQSAELADVATMALLANSVGDLA
ncbi:carboxymethylenebutenolidase [Sphingobium sp. AP50]|uniref:dienelactone hydrolase family protein n=1 Tax=Sphingobium sp. AP50 TaxID=1884369 RepID=UPI0008C5F3B5|nr:dienelactone hydrolase family protein [Sphingobium sp. AP50]SEK00221.1 carboxymethylenebutenolidase [Sphingobium sp. AP50]